MKQELDKTEPHYIKAIRMKPEFDQLSYSDKLKFMDDHFGGCSGIGDPKGEMIISISPDPKNKDEIILFNERFIRRYENFKDDIFIDYSFDRLKQRFDNEILKIINSNPDRTCQNNLIKEHIKRQLEIYIQRMTMEGPTKWTKEYYKGNWDLSKKVIDTSFLQARAWENYIGFLQSKINVNVINKPDIKNLPALPDCFIDKNYFLNLIKNPSQLDKYFEILDNGNYRWKGTQNQLAGFAHRLKNKGKLIENIKSGPDLAKVFCSFFNVVINEKEAKQFQPDRAKIDEFYFIT